MKTPAVALQLLQHGYNVGILNRGIQVNQEDKLKVSAGNRAALQLGHVDAQIGEQGQGVLERSGLVIQGDHQANLVAAGIDGGTLGEAANRV